MNFSAVILAGGKSSRMGRDKARLEVAGEPLLARQIRLARESGAAEIFISGRGEMDYAEFGGHTLPDAFPGAGPLAGIEPALRAATSSLLLVLAVDLPAVSAEFLQRLAAVAAENFGVIPRLSGQIEPLAAIYPKSSLALVEARLRHQQNSVMAFAAQCVQSSLARWLELSVAEAHHFTNWNTPADFSVATGQRR
jgi:molybdopterin-guanine dinucleotide biosynthesis protein A